MPEGHHSTPALVSLEMPASPEATVADAFTGVRNSAVAAPSRNFAPLSPMPIAAPAGTEGHDGPPQMWPFLEALQTRRPLLVPDCSGLTDGYPKRVWNLIPKSAVIIPAFIDSSSTPGAVLVLGLHLPYDTEYKNFIVGMIPRASLNPARVR